VKYVSRTLIAMTLFAFCWVAAGYGVNQMLGIGTCASGGPYVSARQCPDGTEAVMFALMGGIVLLFVAGGIYMTRGNPPGGAPPANNSGIVIWFWTGLFWSLAAGCFLGVWGPDANPGPGGETGGLIVGFMGLVMGAGGLLALRFRRSRKPDPAFVNPAFTRLAGAATRFSGAADPVSRIDTLERLRGQGTLTDAEFETLKSKIIGEA
jgi:peptidoglycan/LPS O-acetylase OafA/YrhL